MASTLVSSLPGIHDAFKALVKEACESQEAPTFFFDFELNEYEPSRYVILTGVGPHIFEWEGIGTYEQREHYSLHGFATVFTGDSPATNPEVPNEVLAQTYTLFQETVMRPVLTDRNVPILGTTGPSPFLVLPGSAQYSAGVGTVDGAPAGWQSRLDWSFNFSAIVTPQQEE